MTITINNTRYAVFHAYKQLLKVQKQTFQGDTTALKAAKCKTREEFLKNKDEIDTNKIQKCINKANDIMLVLQRNVVQGVMEESSDRFILKLHENHELGDNESIKNP